MIQIKFLARPREADPKQCCWTRHVVPAWAVWPVTLSRQERGVLRWATHVRRDVLAEDARIFMVRSKPQRMTRQGRRQAKQGRYGGTTLLAAAGMISSGSIKKTLPARA